MTGIGILSGTGAKVNSEIKSAVTIISFVKKSSMEVKPGDELLFKGLGISW